MNAIRTALLISLFVACGCGAPPSNHVHTQTRSKPSMNASTTGDEPADAAAAIEEAAQRKFELLIPTKEFDKDPATGALLVTFEDLNLKKVLGMELVTEDVVTRMPEWMRSLNGEQIRIRGYMYPTYEAEDISRFVLLYSAMETNFGAPIHPYQIINVTLKNSTTPNCVPANRTLDVVGRFKIDLAIHEGNIVGLFRIDDATIPTTVQ